MSGQDYYEVNNTVDNITSEVKNQNEAYTNSFFLSKFNVNEDSSTITNMKFSMKLKDLNVFDAGDLHSFDVFKKKASAMVSNDKLDILKQMKNGDIIENRGLAYSIYLNSSLEPSFTGYSTSFNSLSDAIGPDNINNIQNGQFRIIWSGFFISKNTSSNSTLYNFTGTNTNSNESNTVEFKVKIDDGLINNVNSIKNTTFQQYLYENTLYPIRIIYDSPGYSPGDDLSFKIYKNSNSGMVNVLNDKLFYLNNKSDGTLYKQPIYYFGILKIQQLYRFYFINDTEYKMYVFAQDPFTTNIESLSYKDNDGKPIVATTADVTDDTQVNIYRLNTDYKVNKTFYVNEYDKQMTFVPYNADILKPNAKRPYILGGNFAPAPKDGIANAKTVDNYNECKVSCDNNANCTSFYYLENREYISKIEKKEIEKTIDVSYIAQETTVGPVPKEYNATTFNKVGNQYVPFRSPFSRTVQGQVTNDVVRWKKETITEMVDQPVDYPITVNKCIINTDDNNYTNLVSFNKMNSIQPNSSIISSQLYIKNKYLAMDPTYMPIPISSKNSNIGYKLSDNYTQGYAYIGDMFNPILVGKASMPPVQDTQATHDSTLNALVNSTNKAKQVDGFNARSNNVEPFDGINATSNSLISQLYTINSLNSDISGNLQKIRILYGDLSGNCSAAASTIDYQNCIKYKFSTNDLADITKKITDKNDAYQEDLTEVQLQQNNMYVLGAITTASLLIFAIMLARE